MNDAVQDVAGLTLAVRNAATMWTVLAQTRGHELIRRPGYLAVNAPEPAGLRVLMLSAEPSGEELAEVHELVRRRAGDRLLVEDSFAALDLGALGLTARQLPVMIRRSGAELPPPSLKVTRVDGERDLEIAEHVVVHGFPLEPFQPYRPRQVFPPSMLAREEVALYLTGQDGTPFGACLTVADGAASGLYWVTTLLEHRSRGVGRALMHGVLARLGDLPVTLSAAKAGKPLYDSLGFSTVSVANWWS
ncbi:GNAT family N-acetyltransferase [Nonomuraea antri]|uniref:GNAT family N-acetyltransferase n=1 Tax=Nonomuraea antri TaxID=2730852 RepID=UPI001569E9BF|nr:GNAT family N-acetyltransferase [Nonomuraea antri]